jgi:hypothetical protein
VGCGSGLRMNGPVFFKGIFNLECYENSILELFFQMPTEEEKQLVYMFLAA